jgi:hypothetical protein
MSLIKNVKILHYNLKLITCRFSNQILIFIHVRFPDAQHKHDKDCHHDPAQPSASRSQEVTAAVPDMTLLKLTAAGEQWRTLSYALIGVLCIICSVVIFVGIYACTVCRRTKRDKQYCRQPGECSHQLLVLLLY